jgi:hypothetical protein
VFDNTPAAKDGTLQSGDELVGVNGVSVKGKTKVEVAKMIQASKVRNILGVPEMITLNFTAPFFLILFLFHFHACENHSPPSSAKVKNEYSYSVLLLCCMCAWHAQGQLYVLPFD